MIFLTIRGGSIQIVGERTDFVTQGNGDFEIRGGTFFIQDVVANKEYWLGPYDNVTNEIGVLASSDALITYLTNFFSVSQGGAVSLEDEQGTPIDENNPLSTAPLLNLDAFGRLRVSNTGQRIDVEFKYDLQEDLFAQLLTGAGATISHNATSRDVSIKQGSLVNADMSEFVQKWSNPYTAGNSQLIDITGTADKSGVNTLTAYTYLRDGITGTETETAQAAWSENVAVNRDGSKSQIFAFDFQSLKVGNRKFYVQIDGVTTCVNMIKNDNKRSHGYWQDPNQPLVWRVFNTLTETITEIGYDDGVNGIGFRFKQPLNAVAECIAICGTVKSEGGGNLFEIEGFPVSVGRGVSGVTVGASYLPILSVRARLTHKGFLNKIISIPEKLAIQTDNDIHYRLVHGGTLTGAVWIDADANTSSIEYDISATALTGGHVIESDYLATGSKNSSTGESGFLGKSVLSASTGISDILTLEAVRNSGTNATVFASIKLKEII